MLACGSAKESENGCMSVYVQKMGLRERFFVCVGVWVWMGVSVYVGVWVNGCGCMSVCMSVCVSMRTNVSTSLCCLCLGLVFVNMRVRM